MSKLKSIKLVYSLGDLEPAERREFRKYVAVQREGKEIFVEVLEHLEKYLKKSDTETELLDFAEEAIGKRDNTLVVRIFSKLYGMLRAFLIYKAFSIDSAQAEAYWAEVCAERGWERELQKPPAELDKVTGWRDLHAILRIAEVRNGYFSDHLYHEGETGISQVHASLDLEFLLQKLKYCCASFNELIIHQKPFTTPQWLHAMLADFEKRQGLPEVIRSYAAAFRMLKSQAQSQPESARAHFGELFDLLENARQLDREEFWDLYTYALNYLIIQVSAGAVQGKTVYFVVEKMLEREEIVKIGNLPPRFFKLITHQLCKRGMLEEAEKFVEESRSRIVKKLRKQCYTYNKAVVAFHRGELGQAMKLLAVDFERYKDVHYDLGSRLYRYKIAFLQHDWEVLEKDAGSLRIQVFRLHKEGKISMETREQFNQLQRYCHRVVRVMTAPKGKRRKLLDKLIAQLQAEDDQLPTCWLLEALQDM